MRNAQGHGDDDLAFRAAFFDVRHGLFRLAERREEMTRFPYTGGPDPLQTISPFITRLMRSWPYC